MGFSTGNLEHFFTKFYNNKYKICVLVCPIFEFEGAAFGINQNASTCIMSHGHVCKIFNDTCPHYLKFDFTCVSSVHKYNTRGSPFNFVVPLAKGQAKFTFYSTAIHHWNSLPNEIKSISDFNLFKKLVKKH